MCSAVSVTLREFVCKTPTNGTVVRIGNPTFIVPWAINRSRRYCGDDAEDFRPERWIGKMPNGGLRANEHGGAVCEATFLPGPRACIGHDLAAAFGSFEVERPTGDTGKVRASGQVIFKPMGSMFSKTMPIPDGEPPDDAVLPQSCCSSVR